MQISLKFSIKLMLFFIAIHLCATLAIWSSFAPLWLKVSLTGICLCSFIYVTCQYVWLNASRAVVKVVLTPDQKWELVHGTGVVESVTLRGDTFISPFGIILNFKKTRNSRASVLICPDSVVGEQFRQLCVRLRTGR